MPTARPIARLNAGSRLDASGVEHLKETDAHPALERQADLDTRDL
jgi:hypothetical protein